MKLIGAVPESRVSDRRSSQARHHHRAVYTTALLQAVADKLIPGISTSVRILLVSQVEDTSYALLDEDKDTTVLQHVIHGDKKRADAMKEFDCTCSIYFILS